MTKRVKTISVSAALLGLVLGLASSATALDEDFSQGLDDWHLVVFNLFGGSGGDLAPGLDTTRGLPPPSLDVNGDRNCGNGVYSKQTFDYANGLVIQWDMYVASAFDWNWGRVGLSDHSPNLSLPRGDAYLDNLRCDSEFLAWIELVDDANFNTQPPFLRMGIVAEDGLVESSFEADATYLQNAWHHYEIHIGAEGFTEFHIDGVREFATTKRIDRTYGSLPVLLGDRDGRRIGPNPVRIDNVSVTRSLVVDVKPGSCQNPINVKSNGVLPVAIVGTDALDVTQVNPMSVRLEGVSPQRSSLGDTAAPDSCDDETGDGIMDLKLKFSTRAIAAAIGPVTDRAEVTLTLEADLDDGTHLAGQDVVLILNPGNGRGMLPKKPVRPLRVRR